MAQEGYALASEYLLALIRDAQKRRAKPRTGSQIPRSIGKRPRHSDDAGGLGSPCGPSARGTCLERRSAREC